MTANARLDGLEGQLGMKGNDFNTALVRLVLRASFWAYLMNVIDDVFHCK